MKLGLPRKVTQGAALCFVTAALTVAVFLRYRGSVGAEARATDFDLSSDQANPCATKRGPTPRHYSSV
jgi:hypothetical protein